MNEFKIEWKLDRGHYDPANCRPYDDQECDLREKLLRERAAEIQTWTPTFFKRLFGIRSARSGQSSGGPDKETVRERASVLALLASRGITHRVVGGNVLFVCPFHDDHRPSASFSVKKKLWHCHVEGIGGDVFSFIQRLDGVSFGEAVEVVHRSS